MCHQTVSLIARHLEGLGIPTLCLASALDIIEAGNPPRSVFIDYPLGHTCGKPFDPEDQYAIARASLAEFETQQVPGAVVHLPNQWATDDAWKKSSMDPSQGDTRRPRDTTPQYQTEEDRRLAEGA